MPEATPKGITKVHLTDVDGNSVAGTGTGGPASIADGDDVAQGARADAVWDGVAASATVVSILKKIATSGAAAGLTDAQLRATAVPVSGPITDAQLRATAVPVSGTFWQATQPVSGTFWQATQPVSGPVTDAQLRASAVPVSGPLTDTQLRASAVPVSGTFWQGTQPVSAASLPLPAGAATEASLALQQIATGTAVGTLKHQVAGAQANASAPSWTEATFNPLSQTLAGALRIAGTVTATGPLTDTQLRATAVPVSGTFWQATQPVSIAASVATTVADGANIAQGAKADAAWVSGDGTVISLLKKIASAGGSAVSIADGADVAEGATTDAKVVGDTAGTVSAKLRGINTALAGTLTVGTHAVTGPLTDAQLRASAVPVSLTSTTITGSVAVTGPLTDAQLRAATVPVRDSEKLVDNAAFTDGTTPVDPVGFIYDEVAGTALTENDIGAARMNLNRAQIGVLEDGATRGRWATVSAANALKVDGSGVTQPVSGPLTDAQLRASAVPVSLASTTITGTVDVSDRAGRLLGIVDKGKIWDGTNIAAVKAASTAAIATDPALVVAVSPNNTVGVTGTFWQATQPVSGTFWQATQPVSGPLTDAQLRASAVPVSLASTTITGTVDVSDRAGRLLGIVDKGKVWDGTNIAAVKAASTAAVAADPALVVAISPNNTVPVSGPLTDAQLRASAVPVSLTSTTITGSVAVTGPLTDTQLRAASVNVTPSTAGTDAGATKPSVNLVGGYDGLSLLAAKVQNRMGSNVLHTYDQAQLQRLEELLVETQTQADALSRIAEAEYFVKQRAPVDQSGAWYVRPRQVAAYGAQYRLAAATAGLTLLSFVYTANVDKQLVTIYHTGASKKTVRIQKISLNVAGSAGTGFIQWEVRRLGGATAPATGNPVIIPGAYDLSDPPAEVTCLTLPTTAGSEIAPDSPVSGSGSWNTAVGAATAEPARQGQEWVLFDARSGTGVGKPLVMRAGVAEGFAIISRDNVAGTFNFTAFIEFTEE